MSMFIYVQAICFAYGKSFVFSIHYKTRIMQKPENILRMQCPAVIAVVDHQLCLTAVDADIFAGDKSRFFRGQKQHHIGYIQRIAHPTGRLLDGIRTLVNGICVIDPAGGHGVNPDPPGKADRQCMSQGGNAAFGGGVAFALGLTHPIPGGGDVDDA